MMEIHQSYYGGDVGVDDYWSRPLAANPPMSSSSPLVMSGLHQQQQQQQQSSLPLAVVPPADDHGALAMLGGCSSLLLLREEEPLNYLPPMIAAPAAGDGQYMYEQPLDLLPPLPAIRSPAGLDDELLMLPFSDIDLDAFADAHADDSKDEALDAPSLLPPADHYPGSARLNAYPNMDTMITRKQQEPARGVDLDHGHRNDSMAMVVVAGYAADETRQKARPTVTTQQPPMPVPMPAPAPARARRSGADCSALSGKTRLDHIGFEDLRKYFYMPITKAAREMNVGLTVLKKRCRELGVARWPHRKMKSLKSLILNVQEMGSKGMPAAAIRRELAALETCCALMEENPAIELTEQTKKLRQACFKENYKRRRAAAVNVLDHCYGFGGHHTQQQQQQHALPPPATAGHHDHRQLRRDFFGY